MQTYHYNLGQYFEEVASAHSQRPALRYPEQTYSYQQLSRWVESLAALLIARECRRGSVIAIGHNKQPLSFALMLAALRLGVGYVNLDVASPAARTKHILQVSCPSLLFYDDARYADTMAELASGSGCPLLFLAEDQLPRVAGADLEQQKKLMGLVDGASIAYIMFTSGSTGVPKGVAVTHENVVHFIAWGQNSFGITDLDNFANLSPMYFDNSVFDFYVGLFSGASLSPVYREYLTSPYELVSYVGKMGCSIWFSVPSLLIYLMAMKAMTPTALPTLRTIVFGGEGYPKVELKKLYDLFSGQGSLVNVYGPTECTCICSAYTLRADDFHDLEGLPALGHLNPNFDYRILDEDQHDAKSGELCLIGPNVAAGYFNDLERTSAVFCTLIDSGRFMKRMYRTGDLVREADDGTLYFLGRRDNQIKHMGYRIELEEIEHALMKLPHVNQAAAVYHRTNAAYGKLIGFVAGSDLTDEKPLLEQLANLLPNYMLPNKLVIMSKLPKNANGKVDRQQLRALLSE
ncbi:MAG: AMP-binding protein [Sulfuritalea sp.]|nr:AMP-binding protein [Sulfuritalea sp.]